ncbi:MAG: 30S ribosome-binding factor RbfA [Christensenellales bacterium]|jgi:ribosome-binding factor A
MLISRTLRVAEEIKKNISVIIRQELKNPDIPMLTSVMRVECTKDLKHAKVYVSFYGEDNRPGKAIAALNCAAGMIRNRISRMMTTHTVPNLQFVEDVSINHAMHINELLKKIKEDNPTDEGNDELS